jgi:hypothetical protein
MVALFKLIVMVKYYDITYTKKMQKGIKVALVAVHP